MQRAAAIAKCRLSDVERPFRRGPVTAAADAPMVDLRGRQLQTNPPKPSGTTTVEEGESFVIGEGWAATHKDDRSGVSALVDTVTKDMKRMACVRH